MYDCNKEIRNYENDDVRLSSDQHTQLKERRDKNRARLKKGLEKNGHPLPEEFVIQGSRAAKTTIQESNNSYDIDDGAIFDEDDLVGSQGAPLSALDARKRVRDAVDDGSFKTPPIVKTNCVRIYYDDGPHVDQPVYRHLGDGKLELASADWRESNPRGVNDWFKNAISSKTGDGAADQMREGVRLLKAFCKNRSLSLPSGFALTVLLNEAFWTSQDRLDKSIREVMTAIHTRLTMNLIVAHPVVDENLVGEGQSNLTANLRDELKKATDELKVLDQANCAKSKALKAWKSVFKTNYFDDAIATAEANEKKVAAAAVVGLGATAPRQWAE